MNLQAKILNKFSSLKFNGGGENTVTISIYTSVKELWKRHLRTSFSYLQRGGEGI